MPGGPAGGWCLNEVMTGGLWAPSRRALTAGLVLTVTFVAAEALAVITVMPVVARDLHGLRLYGPVFSVFMLGTVVGIVAAGRQADRRGPAIPYVTGLVFFGSGLVVAGLAPSMPVLVAGRLLQGLGAGAIPSMAYVAIGRSLPKELQARMMAMLSTAWVVPGLAGPALAAEVARLAGWRWVFLGLLPFVVVTGPFAIPALRRLGPPESGSGQGHRLIDGLGVAAGTGLLLAGLTMVVSPGDVLAGAVLIVAGTGLGMPVLARMLPAGTLRARAGLPATTLIRGLLTFGYFGADAYVTLAITLVRHRSPALAGLAITGATLTWTAGSWFQARMQGRWEKRRLIWVGAALILCSVAAFALVLRPGIPVAEGIAAWTLSGFGMGMAYASISLLVLAQAPPGREGWAVASLNLSDVLGSALGIGLCGAAVAARSGPGGNLAVGVAAALALAALALAAALLVTRRLPGGDAARGPATNAAPDHAAA